MAEYSFHPTLVLRTPVYNYHLYSESSLSGILKQRLFQKAIYFASEVFYNELKKVDFDLAKLDKKAIETVRKYFNRMCYRPTPFGIYAAVGALKWDDKPTNIKFSQNNLHPDIQLSHAKSIELGKRLLTDNMEELKYKLTSAIYKTGSEFRFIKPVQSETAQIDFFIDSIKTDQFFKTLIKFLVTERTVTQICSFVIEKADCSKEQALTYIQWLIDNSVIINSLSPNITGERYIERLLKQEIVKTSEEFAVVFSDTEAYNYIKTLDEIDIIPNGINNDIKSAELYVNLQLELPNATLDEKYKQDILDGIHCLNKLNVTKPSTGKIDFIKNFNRKFENRAVPLLIALDPEIGVSYGNLAEEDDNLDIIKGINNIERSEKNTSITWSNLHTLFFDKWNTRQNKTSPITIMADDLELILKEDAILPPSISVMFRVFNNKVLIESAGGVTATGLIGRFTPLDTTIEALAKDIALKESEYNSDVIFAEITHVCNTRSADIDRRTIIHPYEIPILVESTVDEKYQIPLSDLWVSVVNGEVVLQSKKHNKRVIPRLSSAFNYTRNDLAVFRFFCDLQHQGIKSSFNFDLNKLFPDLDFYPRVEYKNTILQLAYWNIKNELFNDVLKASEVDKPALFNRIKCTLGLPDYIALTQSDNQLVFDLNNESDIVFFLDIIKTQSQFIVKEYLLPGETAVVANGKNEPHVNQFITSLYQTCEVYKCSTAPVKIARQERRKIIPGEEWLYFKIYCHPIRSNELLSNILLKILNKLIAGKLISHYFFIRYFDPHYHIRLRLKIELGKHQEVLAKMYHVVIRYINENIITDYLIGTYERELERYHPQFMNEFEYSFYASSNLVIRFLKSAVDTISNQNVLDFAMVSTNDILTTLGLEGQHLVSFLESMFNSFSKEFSNIDNLKYQLDTEYRKQKSVIEMAAKNAGGYYKNLQLVKSRVLFVKSLVDLKKGIAAKRIDWQTKWIADIIHMHLNRLFTTDSRKQEMAVYYFLVKYHKSVQARLKKI